MGNPYEYGGDYRRNIFDYYGLIPAEFNDFVVHHIDMNRRNMDIRNLLLVPKNLHIRYHLVLRKLGGDSDGISNMKVNLKINQDNVNKKDIHADKIIRYINEYKQIKRELEIWFALKKCRDWLAEHK